MERRVCVHDYESVIRTNSHAEPATRSHTTRSVLLVAGMRGAMCRECVAAALESVGGVTEVVVNLLRGQATVVHGAACRPEQLVRAIEGLGYAASVEPSPAGVALTFRARTCSRPRP